MRSIFADAGWRPDGAHQKKICNRAERDPVQVVVHASKVWRDDGDSDPLAEGLQQIDEYLDGVHSSTGWLVIFDRRPTAPKLVERLGASKAKMPSGKEITVVRA